MSFVNFERGIRRRRHWRGRRAGHHRPGPWPRGRLLAVLGAAGEREARGGQPGPVCWASWSASAPIFWARSQAVVIELGGDGQIAALLGIVGVDQLIAEVQMTLAWR